MVNLTEKEWKYLRRNTALLASGKPIPTVGPIIPGDYSEEDFVHPIYVVFNCKHCHLPSYLQWRASQCYAHHTILERTNKGKNPSAHNYKLIFQVKTTNSDYVFPDVVGLYLQLWDGERLVSSDFYFYVQQNDLDKYFKRYYPEYTNFVSYFTKEGFQWRVVTNPHTGIMSLTNVKGLLVSQVKEPKFTGKAYCHKLDTFDPDKGVEIAVEDWRKKWKRWFSNEQFSKEVKTKPEVPKIEISKSETPKNEPEISQNEIEKKESNMKVNLTPLSLAQEENRKIRILRILAALNAKKMVDTTHSHNYIGCRHGNYIITGLAYKKNKQNYWQLVCPMCGNQIISTYTRLAKGKVDTVCFHKAGIIQDEELKEYAHEFGNDIDIQNCSECTDVHDRYTVIEKKKEEKETKKEDCNHSNFSPVSSEQFTFSNDYLTFKELYVDLFNYAKPWDYIAHCIPADFSFGGAIAKRINKEYDMQEWLALEYDMIDETEAYGKENDDPMEYADCIPVQNIMNLVVAPRKFAPINLQAFNKALRLLAECCYYAKVKSLVMPKLGCGSFKLTWADENGWGVRKQIIDTFTEVYTHLNETHNIPKRTISIAVCYLD